MALNNTYYDSHIYVPIGITSTLLRTICHMMNQGTSHLTYDGLFQFNRRKSVIDSP